MSAEKRMIAPEHNPSKGEDSRFLTLINYIQPTGVVGMWQEFDYQRFTNDSKQLKADGIDIIRVLPPWHLLQPDAYSVSKGIIDVLVYMANVASANNQQLMPTLWTFHLGGYNEFPSYAYSTKTNPHKQFRQMREGIEVNLAPKNFYEDQEIAKSQVILVKTLAEALGNSPGLWGWNVANEITNALEPASKEEAENFSRRIVETLRSIDQTHPIVIGHSQADIEQNRNFGYDIVGKYFTHAALHVYPRFGELPPELNARKVMFYALFAQWLSDKKVFLEEFGEPTTPLDLTKERAQILQGKTLKEDDVAKYTAQVFDAANLLGLIGVGVWASTDIYEHIQAPTYHDQKGWPHERHFGIYRIDQTPKPSVDEIRKRSGRKRREQWSDFSWIDETGITRENFYNDPLRNLQRAYPLFTKYYAETVAPKLNPKE